MDKIKLKKKFEELELNNAPVQYYAYTGEMHYIDSSFLLLFISKFKGNYFKKHYRNIIKLSKREELSEYLTSFASDISYVGNLILEDVKDLYELKKIAATNT